MNLRQLILLLSILTVTSFSQTTYEFLRLDMSARAASLGGSFTANTDDPNVLFYNPAGMYTLQGSPASFSFLKHLLDINVASVTYSQNFEGIGRFGAGIKYINYGKFPNADEFGYRNGGEYGASEAAFIVGYAGSLDNNFNYGANIKYIFSGIADRSSSALGFDLGIQYIIPEQNWAFGLAALNMGSQLTSYYTTKEKLPLDIILGISKKLQYLPLRIYLDFHKLNQESDNITGRFQSFSLGTEFNLSKVLRLRLGYDNEKRKELKIGTSAGLAGFNVGLGALISGYNFDYGFSSLGYIGAFHRISITTTF